MKRILPVLLLLAAASSAVRAAPPISSISPTSTTTCTSDFSLTVVGTLFTNKSEVHFGATLLAITSQTTTQLVATVPATSVATAGSVSVTVVNPSGSNVGTSNVKTFTISNPPAPVVTGGTQTGTVGIAFTYQIVASNCPTSYNATGLPSGLNVNTSTGLISGTPAAGTDTGSPYSVTISATNAGGTGNATLTLTIKPAAPVITSSLTATGQVGVAFSYQITATNNPTSYNATVLPAGVLPAGLSVNTSTGLISGTPTTAGTYSVTISATNSGGTGSATLTLTINNPLPTTTSISPTSTTAGSAQFTLTVNGTKFVSTSTVNWNGSALTTNFVSSIQLTAIVPAANVATAGTASITVVNPPPAGGTSNSVTFTINNPVPTTTSISPTCIAAGSADFILTVNGTKFVSTSTVNWNGAPLATSFVSSTQLTATVPASLVATAGTASVTVANPSPGGGTSNAQTFTIANTPAITSPLTATGKLGVAFS